MLSKFSIKDNPFRLNKLLNNLYLDNHWKYHPHTYNPHMSHDNMTAIVCAAKRFNFPDILSNISVFDFTWQRWHPRDIIFYGYLKYKGLLKLLFGLFMWIPALCMIISCAQDYKYREGREILKTDGKLLAWLRFNTINMPLTAYICTKLIERNNKFKSWKNVFSIYFEDKNHPINKLWEEIE